MKTLYIEMPETDQNVLGVELSRMFLLVQKMEPYIYDGETIARSLCTAQGPIIFVHVQVKNIRQGLKNALISLMNRGTITSFSEEKSDAEIKAGVQEMVEKLAALLIDPARTADEKATYAEALMNHFRQTAASEAAQATI